MINEEDKDKDKESRPEHNLKPGEVFTPINSGRLRTKKKEKSNDNE